MSDTEPVVQSQPHLSEDLHLLRKLSTPDNYHRTQSTIGRILDVVALFLATGESNPTVVTFWREEDAKLYIARSPPSDNQKDAAVAKAFFDNVQQAEGYESMIPFLATYCQASVNKRIDDVRDALLMAEEFFPESDDPTEPFPHLKKILQSQPPFVFDRSDAGISTFKELMITCRELLETRSGFFDYRLDDPAVFQLQRRLDELARYLHIGNLVRFLQRGGTTVNICWVPDVEMSSVALTMDMTTILNRHLEVIPGQNMSSAEELRDRIILAYGGMPSVTITPHVHAEIKLILYVSENVGPEHLKGNSHLTIGSNKRSCFACRVWRKRFNSAFKLKWRATYTYSLPCSDWAIPCENNVLPLRAIDSGALRSCYEAVSTAVQNALKVALDAETDIRLKW